MKVLLLALALWQIADGVAAPTPEPAYFRYRRDIVVSSVSPKETIVPACAPLDGAIYAHGSPFLKDVRLYQGTREVPYAITLSESVESDSESAKVLNPGMQNGHLVFLLAMPSRPYTDVTLGLDAHDFIASATVWGIEDADPPALTKLGTYTLFDLTSQHLSRNTTLHLQESTFQKLRVDLETSPAPGAAGPFRMAPELITGAMVPPNREAQIIYTTVAEGSVMQRIRQTVAHFHLRARVPVERISFELAPGYAGNFSRNIEVIAYAEGTPGAAREILSGNIFKVRMQRVGGLDIRQEQLSIPATLGANLQQDADVEVRIDNGNDTPLPLSAIKLEMRERKICFNVPTSPLMLFYGDPALEAPMYDFARVLSLAEGIVPATLAAEQLNSSYHARPVHLRPLTERHPELLWIALLGVVCILALMAFRSSRRFTK